MTAAPTGPADCPVRRTVYGNACDGPGTYYCDSDIWNSQCRCYFEKRLSAAAPTGPDPRTDAAVQQDEQWECSHRPRCQDVVCSYNPAMQRWIKGEPRTDAAVAR